MENHGGDKGVGLGSELSQLIALTVLDGVDHYAKEKMKAKYYVRYMDDSVALFKTKEEAKAYLIGIKEELVKRGLETSKKKTLVFPIKNGIDFLGWRYILKSNGRIILKPKRGKIAKTKRKLRRMARAGVPLETLRQSLDSSIASLKYGNANKEIRNLERFCKEELQMEVRKVSDKERELEKKAKAAEAQLSPLADDVESHKEISDEVGKSYSLSDQIACIRHAVKKLLDKNAIVDEDFEAFNDCAEAIVNAKKAKKGGN